MPKQSSRGTQFSTLFTPVYILSHGNDILVNIFTPSNYTNKLNVVLNILIICATDYLQYVVVEAVSNAPIHNDKPSAIEEVRVRISRINAMFLLVLLLASGGEYGNKSSCFCLQHLLNFPSQTINNHNVHKPIHKLWIKWEKNIYVEKLLLSIFRTHAKIEEL